MKIIQQHAIDADTVMPGVYLELDIPRDEAIEHMVDYLSTKRGIHFRYTPFPDHAEIIACIKHAADDVEVIVREIMADHQGEVLPGIDRVVRAAFLHREARQ